MDLADLVVLALDVFAEDLDVLDDLPVLADVLADVPLAEDFVPDFDAVFAADFLLVLLFVVVFLANAGLRHCD